MTSSPVIALRALACGAALLATAAASQAGPNEETTTTVINRPGGGSNHIEVTGNSASGTGIGTGCAADGAGAPAQRSAAAPNVNVNSVNINGRALEGRTVIVTGRNSQDVQARGDCGTGREGRGGGGVSVNSVNIR